MSIYITFCSTLLWLITSNDFIGVKLLAVNYKFKFDTRTAINQHPVGQILRKKKKNGEDASAGKFGENSGTVHLFSLYLNICLHAKGKS